MSEPFKPFYNVRDIMTHLKISNLSHIMTDNGIELTSQLCLKNDIDLKKMLMPLSARRLILNYMKKFEKHIKAINNARIYQTLEQQRNVDRFRRC